MKISIIGKGSVGAGLGDLFSTTANHQVIYASRSNVADVAKEGEILIIAIPYTAVASIVPDIKDQVVGKIVIDATNPLQSDWSPLEGLGETSAAEAIQMQLPGAYLVKAFNTIFADNFAADSCHGLTCFVAGDDAAARSTVQELAETAGFRSVVETGPLKTARHLEAMAHLNIQLAIGMGRGTNTGFVYIDRGNSEDDEGHNE